MTRPISSISNLAGLSDAGAPSTGTRTDSDPKTLSVGQKGSADVVVIGAGLAGLSAARHLIAHGTSVIVLEARSRPGGRIHSQKLPSGQVIDLGAQFIGNAHTHITALADEARLKRVSAARTGDILYLPTQFSRPRRSSPNRLPLSAIGQLDLFQAHWQLDRSVDSLERADIARLDRIDAASFVRQKTFFDEAYHAIGGYVESELCTPLGKMSAYELLKQGSSVGGLAGESDSAQWFLAEGAEKLAHFLAASIGDSLILDSPVSRIEQGAGVFKVTSARGTYRTRHVIVAVPPQLYGEIGVLPSLPQTWRDVLTRWRIGSVVKTILAFSEPWWRQDGLSGTVFSPHGTFGAVVDASSSDGTGILIAFSTGQSAHVLEQLPDENARIAAALHWLCHVHGASLPNLIGARSINWSADPFSLGGYASRRGMGGWSTAPDLFAPQGRLHFAGTETATRWRSFMDGAVQSGFRAAREILGEQD